MRIAVLISLAVTVLGCRDLNRTTPCFDLVCPPGFACSPAHEQCVATEQLDACDGQPDETPCSFPGVTDGRCFDGACFSDGCGNGIIEPGETCDDGNTFDADGCSADCRSNEQCGNDVIDVAVGERCDDGNTVDGDGCQENCALPRCGDLVVDPDEECDDGNAIAGDGCNPQCTSDETCGNGVIDVVVGEECDDGDTGVGDGCGATCRIEACGNNIEDPGEVCDDGNLLSGDGCSATCLSLEVCGNGVIDPVAGEECDDGGLRSRDGCSSACTVEFPLWTELHPGAFSARRWTGAAYDSKRQRTVMFGGQDESGILLDDTWEFDGNSWRKIVTANAPDARRGHAMVYNPIRDVIVLFGGVSSSAVLNDTWEFDGGTWTKLSLGSPPPDTAYPAMTYDAARQEVVLVTGSPGSSPNVHTWTFNGPGWTLASSSGPIWRNEPGLAYHASRQTVFLLGGWTLGPDVTGQTDTWEWNGTAWVERTGSVPTAHGDLIYDAQRDRLVSYGGYINHGAVSVWSGGSWSDVDPPNKPPARYHPSMIYDAARGVAVLIGGGENPVTGTGDSFDDTWELGDDWSEPVPGPYDRSSPGVTYDKRRGRVVVVGGNPENVFLDPFPEDTWELIDGGWKRTQTSLPNGPIGGATNPVYDATNGVCIMVGGGATLEYGGGSWLDLGLTAPNVSGGHAAVFDSDRGVTVVVAGGATWERASGAWSQITTAGTPPSLSLATYDARRKKVVAVASTTWEYDATVTPPTWTDTGLTGPPLPGLTVGYLSSLGKSVAFDNTGTTWLYDGVSWTQLVTPTTPPGTGDPTLVEDSANKRMLLIGGLNAPFLMWQLEWISGSPEEDCRTPGDEDADGLVDCADPDCLGSFCGGDGVQCDAAGACTCPGGSTETRCDDGGDNDCDGLVDCADPDCAATTYCGTETDCGNDSDDDGDGATDCADPGCDGVGFCEAVETNCTDNEDNDGDGLVDCQDVNCYLAPCESVTP